MSCGIYKITNQVNQKAYIGQSINIEKRWKDHIRTSRLTSSEQYNHPFYQAIRKYGLENFKFEILEECLVSKLDERERYYINYFGTYPISNNRGYNLYPGGQGNYIKLDNAQILEIIDLLQKGNLSYSQIAIVYGVCDDLIFQINYGNYQNIDGFDYPIKKGCKGIKKRRIIPFQPRITIPPKEQLLKDLYELQNCQEVANKYNISTVLLNKWRDQLNIPRKREDYVKLYEEEYLGIQREEKIKRNNSPKPILQIDPDTFNIVNEFVSASEAGRYIGATNWTIIQQCQKFPKLYKNYLWRFKEKVN